jgi:hypothetical protein
VVASVEEPTPSRRLELRTEVTIDVDSWLAVRCGGPTYFDGPRHRDAWERGIFGHTSPIYVATGDHGWARNDPDENRRMHTLIQAGLEHIRTGRRYPEDRITHHHGEPDHDAFLERPFLEAMERVRARMSR